MNTMNAQLQASFKSSSEEQEPLPEYHHILLAVDSSDHSNRSLQDAVQLAGLWNADITGAHVYAAKLHDVRFRQMERSEEHTYELQSHSEISSAVLCLKKKKLNLPQSHL